MIRDNSCKERGDFTNCPEDNQLEYSCFSRGDWNTKEAVLF
jgi:hypothetical protein